MGDDNNDEEVPAAVRGLVRVGKYAANKGFDVVRDLGEQAQQRLEEYQDDPDALQRDLERVAEEGANVTNQTRRALEYVSDETARQAGWSDTQEALQTFAGLPLHVDAYDELPEDLDAASRQLDFERFAGDEFERYLKSPVLNAQDDPVGYAVALRSEAYLREQGTLDDCHAVEYSFSDDVERVEDITDTVEVDINFYEPAV